LPEIIINGLVIKELGNLKVGNAMLFGYIVQTQHKFLHKNILLYYMYAIFYCLM